MQLLKFRDQSGPRPYFATKNKWPQKHIFLSISPLFFYLFKPTNGVQSLQTYVQIMGKFVHRSPSNFEILTSVTSGYLGHTLPIWPWDQCSC